MKSCTSMWINAMVLLVFGLPIQLTAQSVGDAREPERRHKHTRYKLIDIGTFGGPASDVAGQNGVNGAASHVLNDRGTVAGSADTSTIDPYAPNCFFPDCFVSHAFEWHNGVMVDLGTLPGGSSSQALGINRRGLIAGQSQNGVIDPLATDFPEVRAVLWDNGRIIDLGTLGGNVSAAYAINDRGQVVGEALNDIPDPFSFLSTQIRAFLWQEGRMQDLGTLGGPEAWALFINQRGQIAGFSLTNSVLNPITGSPTQDPFLWENGRMIDLGTLGGTLGSPFALSDRGQVVGVSNLAGDLTSHPFLWSKGVLTDLGTLGGDNGRANAINDSGEIVGFADLPGSQNHHAFLWHDGVMTDLGTLGSTSTANAISSSGHVVGRSRIGAIDDPLQHAFLWEKGGPMVDLNTLIAPNSPLLLEEGNNINDRGEIAGRGLPPGCDDVDACGHAFLLIPCDRDSNCDNNDQAFVPTATPFFTGTKEKRSVSSGAPSRYYR